MTPRWERRYERRAARRYYRMGRMFRPLRHPSAHAVGDRRPDVQRRDRLAWWIASTALRLIATREYQGRLHAAYSLGMYCKVAHVRRGRHER